MIHIYNPVCTNPEPSHLWKEIIFKFSQLITITTTTIVVVIIIICLLACLFGCLAMVEPILLYKKQ